jgi:hypothetical protein
MLESLRLDIRRRRYKFDLVTCPRLRKVHLVSARLGRINLPWNNVTHLCAQAMAFEDCLKILQNAPLLDHAEFINIDLEWTFSSTDNPIVIPLKSLKVVGSYVAFLSHLTCPALEELICDVSPAEFVKHIPPFLSRSGPSLRSFSAFNFMLASGPTLIDLLQAMPSLKNLVLSQTINLARQVEDILEVLGMILFSQSNSFERWFLPHLETLEYTGPIIRAKMDLLSPAGNVISGPLRLVELHSEPAIMIPKDAIAFFLELRERGVTVNVWSQLEDILQSSIDHYKGEEESLLPVDWFMALDLSLMQDLLQ